MLKVSRLSFHFIVLIKHFLGQMSLNKNVSRAQTLWGDYLSPVLRSCCLRFYCVLCVCLYMGKVAHVFSPPTRIGSPPTLPFISAFAARFQETPLLTKGQPAAFPPRPYPGRHDRSYPPAVVGSAAAPCCYWTRPSGPAPSPPIPTPQQLCLPATFVSAVRTRSKHVTLTSPRRVVFQRRYQDRDGLPRRRTAKPVFHEYSVNLLKL